MIPKSKKRIFYRLRAKPWRRCYPKEWAEMRKRFLSIDEMHQHRPDRCPYCGRAYNQENKRIPLPLSAGAVKALEGEKIRVCSLRNCEDCLELFYYGKIELGVETHGVGGRDIKLPINTYGSDWIAYRCSPKEEKE